MDERNQDDWLDQRLREAAPYIDDAGFTRGVLAKLPAPQQSRSSSRAVILIGLTIVGSLIAYILSDGGRFLTKELMRLAVLPTIWLLVVAVACGILATAAGFVAALSKSRELQS